jgi:hypothetical protein
MVSQEYYNKYKKRHCEYPSGVNLKKIVMTSLTRLCRDAIFCVSRVQMHHANLKSYKSALYSGRRKILRLYKKAILIINYLHVRHYK